MGISEAEWRQVRRNLFPPAIVAVEPRDAFRWHRIHGNVQAHKRHSSQALAIDVFGYLKVTDHRTRNAAIDVLAASLGIPVGGDWLVDLEWVDPDNRLKEPSPTHVDVMASSGTSLILLECKFTEKSFAPCSKLSPRKGPPQCNGHYAIQPNPPSGSRCALSAQGIRYWDLIPQPFQLGNDIDHTPCPFGRDLYQWMRNAVLAHALTENTGQRMALVGMYAEGSGLCPAEKIPALAREFQAMIRPDGLAFGTITFQRFLRESLEALRAAGIQTDVWQRLIEWVTDKIVHAEAIANQQG